MGVFRNDGIVHDVDVKLGERPVYLQDFTNTHNSNDNSINQQ
jgi:hypothetical protein